MKKNNAKRCEVCNTKEVKFVQNGLGYCGISSVLGSMNIFGFCKAKKKESLRKLWRFLLQLLTDLDSTNCLDN